MNGFEKRRDAKKKTIADAALRLFAEKGADNVTIKEIADKAHVSHVSIYNFYGSKGELFGELAARMIDEIGDRYERIRTVEEPFEAKLRAVMNLKLELTRSHKWAFILSAVRENEALRGAFETMLRTGTGAFLSIVEEGKQAGIVRPNIKNESILMLIDIFTSYFERSEAAGAAVYDGGLLEDLQEIFWHGLIVQ